MKLEVLQPLRSMLLVVATGLLLAFVAGCEQDPQVQQHDAGQLGGYRPAVEGFRIGGMPGGYVGTMKGGFTNPMNTSPTRITEDEQQAGGQVGGNGGGTSGGAGGNVGGWNADLPYYHKPGLEEKSK